MKFNHKQNAIHVNLLKLALSLRTDPEAGRMMRASTRQRVDAMAERLKPLMQAADDNVGLAARKKTFDLAAVRTRDTLKLLHAAVHFQHQVLPEPLTALGRIRLGETAGENLMRVEALMEAIQALPGFLFPPGMTAATVNAVVAEHTQAQAALVAQKDRLRAAAQELRELRPVVLKMWQELALSGWIKANVDGHDQQLAFGLSRKTRRKAKAEQDTTTGSVEVVVNQTSKGTSPAAPVAFPPLSGPKPAGSVSSNGVNGHGVGAPI